MYEVFFIIYPQVPSFASRDWTQIIGIEGEREREWLIDWCCDQLAKRPWFFLADAVLVYSFAAYGGSDCVGSVHFFHFFLSFFFSFCRCKHMRALCVCRYLLFSWGFVCLFVFLLICPWRLWFLWWAQTKLQHRFPCGLLYSDFRWSSPLCVWCLMFDVCWQIFNFFFFFFL